MTQPTPLTPEESELFRAITERQADFALMRVSLTNGEDAAAIVLVQPTSDGNGVDTIPVAVLINNTLFDQITPPEGAETINYGQLARRPKDDE